MNKVYQSINTKSGIVGYVTCGHGRPLVMIVGFSGTLFHWHETFIDELSRHFTLYMMDNRRVGLSQSDNSENLSGMANDVADFIRALKLDKPIVFGWSMGGVIAQELAKSNQLSGLVLMASVPNMEIVNKEFSLFIKSSDEYTSEEYRELLYYYFFSKPATKDTKDSISKNAMKLDNYHYRFNNEAKLLQQKIIPMWNGMVVEDYAKFKFPTLILWARDDLVVPFAAQTFIASNIENAKLIVYPEGGHFVIHKAPQQIARDVNNFYNS
jgi:pimeloyl-ACP methyl ester carboxylesterase